MGLGVPPVIAYWGFWRENIYLKELPNFGERRAIFHKGDALGKINDKTGLNTGFTHNHY